MAVEVNIKLLGDAGVGKTTLFNRFVHNRYVSITSVTLCSDISFRKIDINNRPVNLVIQDTRGFENAGSMMPSNMFRSVDVLLFVYDLSNSDTLYNITSWESHIKDLVDVRRIIVGNKMDIATLDENMKSILERTKKFYSTEDSFEVSAKEGTQCNELLTNIAAQHINKSHRSSAGCVTLESFPFQSSPGGHSSRYSNPSDSSSKVCCKN